MTDAMGTKLKADSSMLAQRGSILKDVNGGYTRAEVTLTQDTLQVDGETATLTVREDGRLHFPHVVPGDPEFEEYSIPHTFTFAFTGGEWLLSQDTPHVDQNAPVPTTHVRTYPSPRTAREATDGLEAGPEADAPMPALPSPGEEGAGDESEAQDPKGPPASVESIPPDTSTPEPRAYSYNKMVDYANRYWKNRNTAYRTYDSDCTNFISQAMRAGGWKIVDGNYFTRKDRKRWFYGPLASTTSYTWAGAEPWYWFASKHSKRTKLLNNVWKLEPSDVLQADWNRDNTIDHSMIVTKSGNGERYLTYRSSNTHNRKLSSLLASHRSAWWYVHRT
ncbi:amidase domain-containing protein [Streptomyces sp. NPDC057445]|uniref:amidase domain-containing protein n=1 Tax=Streptomyces sp. NPDC057445 TaxID=3346136 RepID=UPI0036974A0A